MKEQPTNYGELMEYIRQHEAVFGFKPAAVMLTPETLDSFLEVLDINGSIRSKNSRENWVYEDIRIAGVKVIPL